MVYKGKIKGNKVVFDQQISLTDGTPVEIIPIEENKTTDPICGSWNDIRSADDIIKEIRSSRQSKKEDFNL